MSQQLTPASSRVTGLMDYESDSSGDMIDMVIDAAAELSGTGGMTRQAIRAAGRMTVDIYNDYRHNVPQLPFQAGRIPSPAPVLQVASTGLRLNYRGMFSNQGHGYSRLRWLKKPPLY